MALDFLAVFLHVFVDIFNAYGTQALKTLFSKWVALGMINTFDPFIFGIHVVGLFSGDLAQILVILLRHIWDFGDLLYCQIRARKKCL